MKHFTILIILVLSSTFVYSQGKPNPNSQFRKNALSFTVLGTVAGAGILYERTISNKMSIEAGIGIVGGGVGVKYYISQLREHKILPYLGLTISGSPFFDDGSNDVGIGGNGFMIYIPVGLSYFGKGKLSLGIDFGPGTTTVTQFFYGNFRVGFRF